MNVHDHCIPDDIIQAVERAKKKLGKESALSSSLTEAIREIAPVAICARLTLAETAALIGKLANEEAVVLLAPYFPKEEKMTEKNKIGWAVWKALFLDLWHELKTLELFERWLTKLELKMTGDWLYCDGCGKFSSGPSDRACRHCE